MLPVFRAEDSRGRVTLYHHGYLTTQSVAPGEKEAGFQLDHATAVGLIAAIKDWMAADQIRPDEWMTDRIVTARQLSQHPEFFDDMDPLLVAAETCPRCAKRMERAGPEWLCLTCSVDDLIKPAD